ncbi:MAG: leucine-rich repeat protein [Clostridia bacterium]|nr:leucine-rich repeat protein [Clostridia bacterium]
MKKFFIFLLAVVMIVPMLAACDVRQTANVPDMAGESVTDWSYILTSTGDGYVLIRKFSTLHLLPGTEEIPVEFDEHVKIAAEINGIPVVAIDIGAFLGCSDIVSVSIPESVVSISESAFLMCPELVSITVAKGNPNYKSVDGNLYSKSGDTLLQYATGKTAASFAVPSGVTRINTGAFAGCPYLTAIEVDESNPNYKSVDGNLYSKDGGVLLQYAVGKTETSFTVPSGVEKIDAYAFRSGKLTSVTVADSVTDIAASAFYGCSSLTSINIPDGVASIGSSAFYGCSSLTSINIPDGVTSIGSSAFKGCSGLTSINIPDGVTSIDSSAFKGCSGLMSINIPDGVTSIGSSAFEDCSSLTSITIGNGVTHIDRSAFYGCEGLTSITVDADNPAFCSADGNLYNKSKTTLIQYARGKTATTFSVPDSVTDIAASAFYGCDSLTSINISDGVTSIGSSAFEDCGSLTSINIPDSVTSIGSSAFEDCDSLTSINIPDSVTSIGSSAFEDCDSLTSVYYGGTASEWGEIEMYPSGSALNPGLDSATVYYYSETEPVEEGNYWYYDENGNPVAW